MRSYCRPRAMTQLMTPWPLIRSRSCALEWRIRETCEKSSRSLYQRISRVQNLFWEVNSEVNTKGSCSYSKLVKWLVFCILWFRIWMRMRCPKISFAISLEFHSCVVQVPQIEKPNEAPFSLASCIERTQSIGQWKQKGKKWTSILPPTSRYERRHSAICLRQVFPQQLLRLPYPISLLAAWLFECCSKTAFYRVGSIS